MIDHAHYLDEIIVRNDLKRACESAGGPIAFAAKHNLSVGHIGSVLAAESAPSDKLLQILGWERATVYYRTTKSDAA